MQFADTRLEVIMATTIPNIVNSLTGSTLDIQKLTTDLVAAVRAPQQAAIDTKLTKAEAIISSVGKIVSSASTLKSGLASYGDPKALAYEPVADSNASFTFRPSVSAKSVDQSFQINQVSSLNKVSMGGLSSFPSPPSGTLKIYAVPAGANPIAEFNLSERIDATDPTSAYRFKSLEGVAAAIKDQTGFDASVATIGADKFLTISHGTGVVNRFSVVVTGITDGQGSSWAPKAGGNSILMNGIADPGDGNFPVPSGYLNIYSYPAASAPIASFNLDESVTDAFGNSTRKYQTLEDLQKAIKGYTDPLTPWIPSGLGCDISSGKDINGVDTKYLTVSKGVEGSDQISVKFEDLPSGGNTLTSWGPMSGTSSGQDAAITYNGQLITSKNNTFSMLDDIIININANASTNPPPTVHLTSKANTDICKQVLSDILTAYNQLMQTINNEIKYDKDIKKSGGLANNFVAKGFLWQMRDLTTRQVQISETKFASLADLGVSTNLDGTLGLDQAQLASVVANKPGLLESVISSNMLTMSDDSRVTVKGSLERLIDMADVITASTSSFNALSDQASKVDKPKIELDQTKLEDAMTALTAKYLQQFSAMQTAVQASQNVQSSLSQSMASWSSGLKG